MGLDFGTSGGGGGGVIATSPWGGDLDLYVVVNYR